MENNIDPKYFELKKLWDDKKNCPYHLIEPWPFKTKAVYPHNQHEYFDPSLYGFMPLLVGLL